MLNKVVLMGRLTKDPELKYTKSNTPTVNFSIAVDRAYQSRSGAERQADFINVVAWQKTAEFICQWFVKGQMIIVLGSLQSNSWKDKNGNNRTSINVVASEVQFGESKRARNENAGDPRQAQAYYQQPQNQARGGNYSGSNSAAQQQTFQQSSQPNPNYNGANGASQQQSCQQRPQAQAYGRGFDLPNNQVQPSYDEPRHYSDFEEIAEDDGEVPF